MSVQEIREQFERDVEILRGVGGTVTSADLRAHGERLAYAAMPTRAEEERWATESWHEEIRSEIVWMWLARHEDEQIRGTLRGYVQRLRAAR